MITAAWITTGIVWLVYDWWANRNAGPYDFLPPMIGICLLVVTLVLGVITVWTVTT